MISRAAPGFHSTLWWSMQFVTARRTSHSTVSNLRNVTEAFNLQLNITREKNSKTKILLNKFILMSRFLKMLYFYCILHEVCVVKDNKMLSALLQFNLFILSRKAVFIQIKMSLSPAFSPSMEQQTLHLRLTLT
jgi:hypothetical protein